ncbi:MAG: chemotaxis protein CheW [Bdellovibrionales bacterium]|nr:chemotaxis protein CheW [Bdellovibrionales bacterium]
MADTNDDQKKQLINEFLLETEEDLSTINSCLTHIEKDHNNDEELNAMYRAVHTMKGAASFLQFTKLESLTHSIENILDRLRQKEISMGTKMFDELFASIDMVAAITNSISETGEEGDQDIELRVKALEAAAANTEPVTPNEDLMRDVDQQRHKIIDPRQENLQETQVEGGLELEASLAEAAAEFSEALEEKEEPTPEIAASPHIDDAESESKKSLSDSVVKVNVSLLDKIMNVVGELVLARNQIVQFANSQDNSELNRLATSLNVITTELQSDIMVTRMQPISNILMKYERVMRDLCRATNKKIDLQIEGRDTELDRTVLEAIKDPLSHLVRNAADHGIETPEERAEVGKPDTGTITIKAYHEAAQVTIEIKDDGKGMDRDNILEKAIEKGLVEREAAANYTDKQVFTLIFHAGFSTKEQVTNISGRGVGMDVVQSNIERIGGQVDISSELGKGTTLKLRIPLTLAIIPAMIVKEGHHDFAIPQINLVELVRIDSNSKDQIENLQGSEFFRLRGDLIPVLRLNQVLNLNSDDEITKKSDSENIVVLTAEGYQFGLIVDSILDTQEIVVKPLSPEIKDLQVFAGATIMGNGAVALILDALGFAQHCQLNIEKAKKDVESVAVANQVINYESQEMLLFSLADKGKYCAPLCLVNRLEEFKREDIERVGNQRVVRYRNQVMPLGDMNEYLGHQSGESQPDVISVLVIMRKGQYTGLVVDEVLDICLVEEAIKPNSTGEHGLAGTIFVQDKTYSVVDIFGAVAHLDRAHATPPASTQIIGQTTTKSGPARAKIVLAEDSPFCRNVEKRFLESRGFEVQAFPNGALALDYLKKNQADLVISDIEMPECNGLEFVKQIRAEETLRNLPVIALTTRNSEEDRDKGFKAGFTEYLEKFEEEEVFQAVENLLKVTAA